MSPVMSHSCSGAHGPIGVPRSRRSFSYTVLFVDCICCEASCRKNSGPWCLPFWISCQLVAMADGA